jgi:hypothetical protein
LTFFIKQFQSVVHNFSERVAVEWKTGISANK